MTAAELRAMVAAGAGGEAALLAASEVIVGEPAAGGARMPWSKDGPRVVVVCPAGTTFDAAEALRLTIAARVPANVTLDVRIVRSEPGAPSGEDEAGRELFAAMRRERLGLKA